jgi:L-fuculose-phosphate aldolase
LRAGSGLLITPSGRDYETLGPEDMVFMDMDGQVNEQDGVPSSEWHFHLEIYKARPEFAAIVHTHSRYATALACTGRSIPAFHYMVAIAGGKEIACAPYATFGTLELAQNAVGALAGRKACLLSNHGLIACGRMLSEALSLADEVETLAAQYSIALTLGDIQLLSDEEMAHVLEKFRTYGRESP